MSSAEPPFSSAARYTALAAWFACVGSPAIETLPLYSLPSRSFRSFGASWIFDESYPIDIRPV